MQYGYLRIGLAALLVALVAQAVQAGGRCGKRGCRTYAGGHCDACAAHAPEPTYVEKTVYVPKWVKEKRVVTRTEYRTEQRERRYTVYKCVPEVHEETRHYTVMVPHERTKDVEYTVCKPVWETVTKKYHVKVPVWSEEQYDYHVRVPVWRDVEKTYTVMVPHREKRTGTRTVCRVVPVTKTRTVRRDHGHWEERHYEVPCHGCSGCGYSGVCHSGGCYPGHGCTAQCVPCTRTVCKRVWVPNIVEEEVEYTCYKKVYDEQPYDYYVTVCRPEQRTRVHKVCDYKTETRTGTRKVCRYQTEVREKTHKVCRHVTETRTRQVHYTEWLPEKREKTVQVTKYKRVPEERVSTYRVKVPYRVEKEVEVSVCRRVPKKIMVPVYDGCTAGGYCCK